MLFARRWLPAGKQGADDGQRRSSLRNWVEQYQLTDREHRVRVLPGSPIAGKRREEVLLRSSGVNLLAIERGGRFGTDLIRPQAKTVLQEGDVLLVDMLMPSPDYEALRQEYGVEELPLEDGGGYFTDQSQEIGMVEVILPADSELIGQTVLQARVRREFGLTVIGLRRGKVQCTGTDC